MNRNRNRIPKNCDRCGVPLHSSKMSRFNEDIVCFDCISDEKEAPGYKAAAEEEFRQVLYRNYNFPGVGLDPLSLGFVCGRMARRGIDHAIVAAYAKKHGYPYPENHLPDDRAKQEKG